jgi:hypothetical protein
MLYSEASYFEGFHFAHIAMWEDHMRLARKRSAARAHWVRNRRANRR